MDQKKTAWKKYVQIIIDVDEMLIWFEFPKNLFCETKECFWDMFNNFDGQQVENIVVFKSVQFKTQMFSKKNLWMPTSQGPIAWPSASHVCEPGVGVEVEKDRRIDMRSFLFIPTSLIQGREDKFQMFWQYIGIFA